MLAAENIMRKTVGAPSSSIGELGDEKAWLFIYI
jgi:hypothetical protein